MEKLSGKPVTPLYLKSSMLCVCKSGFLATPNPSYDFLGWNKHPCQILTGNATKNQESFSSLWNCQESKSLSNSCKNSPFRFSKSFTKVILKLRIILVLNQFEQMLIKRKIMNGDMLLCWEVHSALMAL